MNFVEALHNRIFFFMQAVLCEGFGGKKRHRLIRCKILNIQINSCRSRMNGITFRLTLISHQLTLVYQRIIYYYNN